MFNKYGYFYRSKVCNLYVKINLHGASSIKTDSCKLVDDNFSEMNIFKATVIL